MINFVLKNFVKNINNISLTPSERAILRKDFLARTGLRAPVSKPRKSNSFILDPNKKNFKLQLIESDPQTSEDHSKKEEKIQPIENGELIRVCLVGDMFAPETCVFLKIAPSSFK